MTFTTLAALLAATASPETSLGVTATVIRPVEIAAPTAEAKDGVILLRNTAAIEVEASGATVARPDADTVLVTSDGTGPVAITLIF
jgi:hypothetical protein